MKKILFAIAFVTMMTLGANAQRDGFFSSYDDNYGDRASSSPEGLIHMPSTGIGSTENSDAPLGTGLLVLTALGAGYAVARRKK